MAKTYLYISEEARDALEPQVWVARLVSRAHALQAPLVASGTTPDEADQVLRKSLAEVLRRPCYPLNRHLLAEGYFCRACGLVLPSRTLCTAHRRQVHALTSALP